MYVGVYYLLRRGIGNDRCGQKTQSPSQEVVANDLFMLSNILYYETAREAS